jgi:hypothetical protein
MKLHVRQYSPAHFYFLFCSNIVWQQSVVIHYTAYALIFSFDIEVDTASHTSYVYIFVVRDEEVECKELNNLKYSWALVLPRCRHACSLLAFPGT